MGITALFDTPYYTGSSVSTLVPGTYPVSLNGRNYLVSMKPDHHFGKQSIPLIRNQADTGNIPGEQSINPEDLWRRAQDNWTHGAGQLYLDRIDPDVQTFHSNRGSDNTRFRSSKGMDVWSRWQLGLLNDTFNIAPTTNTNLFVISAGDDASGHHVWYYSDGTALKYKLDTTVGAGTAVTGTPATAITSMTSDGFNLYTAHGTNGVYKTTRAAASTSSYATGTVNLVGYVKGRLMAAQGPSIYNITGAGALPAVLFTQANTDFSWVAFAEGQGFIYAAGYSGDKSLIYKTAVKTDGTALDAPSIAGELPDGEVIRSMQGYLGYLCVGTDKGMRFAASDTTGNLTFGSIIPTASPVMCFEPQDRFVWFGWTNYDSTSTGLGRVDLTEFTATLTPAYASDLMATTQGVVNSVATTNNVRVFTVNGVGIFMEQAFAVTSATLDTGLMTFGLPDNKVGMYADLRMQPITATAGGAVLGTARVWVSVDRGAFTLVGADTTVGDTGASFAIGQQLAEVFELRLEIDNPNQASAASALKLTRITMRAYPAPNRNEIATLPLMLYESLDSFGSYSAMNPQAELLAIAAMVKNHHLVTYQEASGTYSVFVDDYEWIPDSLTNDKSFWNGICLTKLKILNQ